MFAASDPNIIVGEFAVGGLALVGLWRFLAWVRDAPATPDPWDAEVEQKLLDPEIKEVCPRCLTEQPTTAWFCARCGSAVGPYNNLMPFVQVFSEGEVFRNGVNGRFRNRPLIFIGYALISIGTFSFLAPIYLILFLLNLKSPSDQQKPAQEQNTPP